MVSAWAWKAFKATKLIGVKTKVAMATKLVINNFDLKNLNIFLYGIFYNTISCLSSPYLIGAVLLPIEVVETLETGVVGPLLTALVILLALISGDVVPAVWATTAAAGWVVLGAKAGAGPAGATG